VLFYSPATLEEIDQKNIGIKGVWLSEGRDYFTPDNEIKEYIKSHPEILEGDEIGLVHDYYHCDKTDFEININEFINNFPNNGDNMYVDVFDLDQHWTQDLDEFMENYIEKKEY
jgi:hypothetical protein